MGSRVLGSTPWAMTTLPDGAAEATEWSSAGATASAIRGKIRIQAMAPPRRFPVSLARRRAAQGSPVLLERHVEGLDALVAPRLPGESLARAIEIELLVQRHRGHLLDPELVD